MKNLILSLAFLMTYSLSFPLFAQIENEPLALGLPGDNLNLYAVLDVFQRSKTLEEFERVLNSKEGNINNLDLNNDNLIDYIRVVSYRDGDSYSIVLRVAVNNSQYQDVAVIEVNKDRFGKILVQIIGDEELYGENYIVEPGSGYASTPNPGYIGNRRVIVDNYDNDIFYVNDWPIIIHLFSPSFMIYISPWHWGFYPSYWRPWSPIFYYNYWGFHRQYYNNYSYRRVAYLRYPVPYSYYYSRRNSSPIVRSNRVNEAYRSTYEGRTFRRPDAPVLPRTRQAIPRNRQENPSTRSMQSNPQRNERPHAPGTRQENPSTRPYQPVAPTNRQSLPVNRPVHPTVPMNRQGIPRNSNPIHNRDRDRK